MLKKAARIVIALCFFLATSGISAQDSQRPDIPKLMQAITDGDSDAMVSLGEAYYFGKGVAKNLELAASLYRRAALAGNLRGMTWYGQVLAEGGEVAGLAGVEPGDLLAVGGELLQRGGEGIGGH